MASRSNILRYNESGHGDPVLLLDWTPWNTTALADALAARYRVVSIEPPEAVELALSVEDTAAAAAGVAEAAGLDSYTLIGVSLGADVAFRLAVQRPASVATMALVSPTCIVPVEPPRWDTPAQAAEAMLAHPENATQLPPDSGRTAVLSGLAKQWREASGDAAVDLPNLRCATLVVFGQEDRLVSRGAGHLWGGQVANCNVCYVYDAGHAIAVERPDALTNVVLDYAERRETFIVEKRDSLINP